jgi:hypothetical protein
MKIAQPHRARRAGKLAAVVLLPAAVVAVVATAALGASTSSPTLRVSTVATVGGSGSKLTVSGSFSCKTRRFFALTLFAVQSSTGATVHGSDPTGSAHAPTCTPPRKSFKIVADQQGEQTPQALKKVPVRVCFIIRSFGPHVPLGLDATCVTVKAH